MSYADIEFHAVWFRNTFASYPLSGISVDGVMSAMELLEVIDGKQLTIHGNKLWVRYKIVPDTQIPFAEARAFVDHGTSTLFLEIRESTYAGLEQQDARAVFSLFHEIGHAVLHGQELWQMATVPHLAESLLRGKYATHKHCEDSEWQADAFAAAVLMPFSALASMENAPNWFTTSVVARRFGVSTTAASIRWKNFTERRVQLQTGADNAQRSFTSKS